MTIVTNQGTVSGYTIFKIMNTVTFPFPFGQQANYFKALAHPVRLQILAILRQGEACVCHLEALLQKRQAYISQQLAVLREAGLVTERKEGLFAYYSLVDANLETILDSSLTFVRSQLSDTELSGAWPLPLLDTCTCPTCTGQPSEYRG
jgi:ArsR family transcriptional regulator